MDVSALNLGMIAAYYNISCKNSYIFIALESTQPCTFNRCHGRSLHIVSQGEDEAQRSSRGGVVFCRIRNNTDKEARGCCTSPHIRPRTREA